MFLVILTEGELQTEKNADWPLSSGYPDDP